MSELFKILFWPNQIGNGLHALVFSGIWITISMIVLAVVLNVIKNAI